LDPAEISQLIGELEERVERLRALYDQYFMGIERLEPLTLRKEVDRRLWALRREQIRNTGMRFKLETTIQRYNTYQQYWQRIVREIENGTYQRDLGRAAQRFGEGAVTAFAKRRQKMFEKGAAKKAERDARRRTSTPPPPQEESPKEEPQSESFDVDFDESEILADQPPLSLDFSPGPELAAPKAPAPRPPLPSVPRAVPPGPPRAPAPPENRISRPKVTAESPGTLREVAAPRPLPNPAPLPPRAPLPSRPDAPPRAPLPSRPEASPPAPNLPPARPPAASRPDIRPPTASQPDDPLSNARLRQIYGQYVEAKRKANESTAAITFDKVAANLRETATQLRAKGKGTVDFEVVMKNGKPVLKPIVKG
jgi:hypothetical protein